ncbi:MAG: large subunit ribosomal protein L23 [Candidatus Binatia bacterium]|jgi:large subunit ribosomal protein L23
MKSPFEVVKAPLITEKGSFVAESGQLIFRVARNATKPEIKQAVEKLFDCKVASVRTVNVLGKSRVRAGRNLGSRPSWKKAYVNLAEGQPMDILESI